jgi:hypothetical protein
MNHQKDERDAYARGLKLTEADLAMAVVMIDMRLSGTWPKGRPAVTGAEANRLKARQRGLETASRERGITG